MPIEGAEQLQYSKTDTKDVKNSRIIPEDVDKSVSSQIEKKYDDRVNELIKDLPEEDKVKFNQHLDLFTSEFSRYKASEITNTLNGLEYECRFWERSFGNGEQASRTHLVQLKKAELKAAQASARREMDYREVRAKALADDYGLRRMAKASFANISRLFEATNQGAEGGNRGLFEKASNIGERAVGKWNKKGDTKTKDIPFVRSLLYTPSEQTSLQKTKSKWYNHKDEMEVTMANVDRLKSKNIPIDKRFQNNRDYYQFLNSRCHKGESD